MLQDALRWGLDPAEFENSDEDGLWPDHLPALTAFLAVQNQWRVCPIGEGHLHYLGLDYTAAAKGLKLAGIKVTPETWSDVQLIETGAVAALNRMHR